MEKPYSKEFTQLLNKAFENYNEVLFSRGRFFVPIYPDIPIQKVISDLQKAFDQLKKEESH